MIDRSELRCFVMICRRAAASSSGVLFWIDALVLVAPIQQDERLHGLAQVVAGGSEESSFRPIRFDEAALEIVVGGHIANRARDERASVGCDRAKGDLDWDFATVSMQCMKIEVGSHRPSLRRGQKRGAMRAVSAPVSSGNELIDATPAELGRGVAEHFLDGCVGEYDRAFGVDHDDRVRR